MPFQFVNTTPDDVDYSPETRRRIRSQAMRDYRRRQRDELQDIESSSEASPPSSLASPSLSSQSISREDSQQRTSRSHSLSVQHSLLRRHSSGTSSDGPPTIDRTLPTGSKRPSPQLSNDSEQSQPSQRRRRRTNEPRAQRGIFSQFMINLPRQASPSTLGEDIDALHSPGRIDQMLQLCERYNTWLAAGSADEDSSTQTAPKPDSSAAQLILSALCLQSIGHLEAIHPDDISIDKGLLKTSVLASLNKRLMDTSRALEDNTIGALACLASYEVRRANIHHYTN